MARAKASSESDLVPTSAQIAERAYHLYLARGAEPGHELEDWFEAERQLTNGPAAGNGQPAAPRPRQRGTRAKAGRTLQ
jgi:hypothetical protein